MKKISTFILAATLAVTFSACKKDVKEVKQDQISESTLAQIRALGFNEQGAQKTPDGYLVEGDIN
ncbi:MAG: hypothetical protein ACJ75F_15415, partial [Flavisolibacter sp.]